MSNTRIAVLHQGCIPTYRKSFFERLAALGEREYVVFHGDPVPGSGVRAAAPPFHFPNRPVRNRYLSVLGRSLVYQPVLREILGGRFDAIVVGHEIKFVASMVLFALFRLAGKPVLFWGFGPTLDTSGHRRGRVGNALSGLVRAGKNAMIRAASGFLAYTPRGAEFVRQAGLSDERITVVYNTIDVEREIAAEAALADVDTGSLRDRLGFRRDSVILAFVGRLTADKQVDLLIEAARRLGEDPGLPPVELAIVGDGPEQERLETLARGVAGCRFFGFLGQPAELAPIFRVSAAVVLPGYVGLTVNHAFAHGRPVITRDIPSHSPEIEYLVSGKNGLLLPPETNAFEEGLREFVRSPDIQRRLAEGARASRETLALDRMVRAFDSGVAAVLKPVAKPHEARR
jgi:glycosyltransferase involved in cell wall biosynthesis